MSLAKEFFLEDSNAFGPDFDFCPEGLRTFICECQALNPGEVVDYEQLLSNLECPEEQWCRFAKEHSRSRTGDTLYVVARGLLVWRPADMAMIEGAEQALAVADGLRLRTTGLLLTCQQGLRWAQADAIWSPALPPVMGGGWLLVAGPDAATAGPLLLPALT